MAQYLITYTDVTDKTPLQGDGADKVKKLNASIEFAHRKLKAILCDELYDDMITAYNGGTPTADETALYPYCVDYLVWESYKAYLGFAQYTDTDAGVRVFTENTSIEAKPYNIQQLEGNAEQFVMVYKTELETFLLLNNTDYPTWNESSCNCHKKRRTTFGISGAGSAKKGIGMNYVSSTYWRKKLGI